ncbi:metal-binding protein [Prevotella denticola DNF00960]|uniref:YecH family metal-binding protein n=1 Tax=Prevotella denticola TaxID=28129 RepID=UPI00050EEFB6|nr:YecH family metal-binding protein [Prevotella denticola]KGF40416.1 metal-binding protein [Prevotella denticola DNF00960]
MAHGHDVLHMMEGNRYNTKEDLVKAIIEHFGAEERFHTCSAEGMDATELVDFLTDRGKFKPVGDGFTVDSCKICNH